MRIRKSVLFGSILVLLSSNFAHANLVRRSLSLYELGGKSPEHIVGLRQALAMNADDLVRATLTELETAGLEGTETASSLRAIELFLRGSERNNGLVESELMQLDLRIRVNWEIATKLNVGDSELTAVNGFLFNNGSKVVADTRFLRALDVDEAKKLKAYFDLLQTGRRDAAATMLAGNDMRHIFRLVQEIYSLAGESSAAAGGIFPRMSSVGGRLSAITGDGLMTDAEATWVAAMARQIRRGLDRYKRWEEGNLFSPHVRFMWGDDAYREITAIQAQLRRIMNSEGYKTCLAGETRAREGATRQARRGDELSMEASSERPLPGPANQPLTIGRKSFDDVEHFIAAWDQMEAGFRTRVRPLQAQVRFGVDGANDLSFTANVAGRTRLTLKNDTLAATVGDLFEESLVGRSIWRIRAANTRDGGTWVIIEVVEEGKPSELLIKISNSGRYHRPVVVSHGEAGNPGGEWGYIDSGKMARDRTVVKYPRGDSRVEQIEATFSNEIRIKMVGSDEPLVIQMNGDVLSDSAVSIYRPKILGSEPLVREPPTVGPGSAGVPQYRFEPDTGYFGLVNAIGN